MLPTITSTTSKAILGANITIAIADQLSPIIPEKYKGWASLAQLIIQAIMTQLAHKSNPDGTPAQAAWTPPGK